MKAVEDGFFIPAVSFIILAISRRWRVIELVANERRHLVVGSLRKSQDVRQFITPGKKYRLGKK